jgi:hypothetical protein
LQGRWSFGAALDQRNEEVSKQGLKSLVAAHEAREKISITPAIKFFFSVYLLDSYITFNLKLSFLKYVDIKQNIFDI